MKRLFLILTLCLFVSGCDFQVPEVDKKFGTQNFVSAISLIELHKTRNGSYPNSLKDLEFLGDWDAIWISAVRYEKIEDGYNLFVERGWSSSEPALQFPVKFKQNLGILDSNVEWLYSEQT